MKAFRLALSLVRVPRLFVSLLFWPMIVGICIALGQIAVSSTYLGFTSETAVQFEKRLNRRSPEADWLRDHLYGSTAPLAPIRLCQWEMVKGSEVVPGGSCSPKPLDVRIRYSLATQPEIAKYLKHFQGSIERIHLCKECNFETAILIDITTETPTTTVTNFSGIALLSLVDTVKQELVNSHFISAKALIEELDAVGGTVLFDPPGVKNPINMSEATRTMILIFNTSLLIVIALWLSLRGHRRVLDYFARNDSLLPLVASCGKNTFYSALWIITLLRVSFFLLMVTPATIIALSKVAPSSTLEIFMNDRLDFILWLFALLSSLASLTIIASIAELKHRSSWISFLYKYIPLFVFFIGTVAWACSLFLDASAATIIRNIVAGCPILGISPVLLSPLIALSPTLLAAHATLASILVLLVMRNNSRWFAAHLEEL